MSETDNEEFYDAEEIDNKEEKLIYEFRTQLPKPMPSKANFSVWQFLKQCIGKELSKITMPIVFNEPISFLQRISEYMEYSYLIHQAIEQTDPIDRMEKISAFAVSVMASNWDRIGKPFNPLLGETYELVTDKFKWVSEQVSHHPPISAFHCQATDKFNFYGSIHPKLKFWGKSVEITPRGTVTLELLPWNEVYTWQNVTCTVHNVIIGKIWIEHSGTMRITSQHSTRQSLISDINCHTVGWFGRNMHRVTGDIYYGQRKSRQVERKLYGKWTEALFAVDPQSWSTGDSSVGGGDNSNSSSRNDLENMANKSSSQNEYTGNDELSDVDDPLPQDTAPCDLKIPNQRMIWRADPRPINSRQFYNFTKYTMGLNQLTGPMGGVIAPTDSRLRRDMRLMEQGFIDEASEAKTELEEKQRFKRKRQSVTVPNNNSEDCTSGNRSSSYKNSNRKSSNKQIIKEGPIWFNESDNPHTKKTQWMFNGTYWDRDWHNCPDIF